ncbi:MAG: PhoH family protein, partial [Deltaproteobacteria bacterium]|nr:PhoH family protein [Deltaproteobacteria bacterium]
MRDSADGSKIFVLDTNVILHDPQALFAFEDHEVVIPIYVIEEIDNFKKDLSELGRNARTVARHLDALRLEGSLTEGVAVNSAGRVRVAITSRELPPEFRNGHTVDNRILATALQCHEQAGKRTVTFVTKDVNLRIRAAALGLLVEDFDSERTDISELYSGVAELELPGDAIDAYYRDGKLALPD